jgi:hypothetical protein
MSRAVAARLARAVLNTASALKTHIGHRDHASGKKAEDCSGYRGGSGFHGGCGAFQ